MVFDNKYFTSTDTESYFTVSDKEKIYDAASGIILGEASKFGQTPLQAVQLAANHGLPSVMLSLMQPQQGVRADATLNVDRMSELQQTAVGEIIKVNNMNFTMHAPTVDIMGLDSQQGQRGHISAAKKAENMHLLKFNMKQADKISETAGLKNTPFCIHTTNGVGSVGNKFDSGYRDRDGHIIYGTRNAMIDRETGMLLPGDSSFQMMNINDVNLKSYKFVPGTETPNGTMALFEITPKRKVEMQNATALNEERKKIAEAQSTINQLTSGPNAISMNDPLISDLRTTIRTAEAQIAHLDSPMYATGKSKRQFVDVTTYSNATVPDQVASLAMHSLKDTKTHPIIAIENEPAWQMGSNPEILLDWVKKSREKFADDLVKKENYDRSTAEDKAKELIGITLDTGHLNTLKSQINPKTHKAWTDKELQKAVKDMAAAGTKLVHIADNIGELGQDTHLMIGRGDVQNAEFLKILKENGFKGQAQFEAFTGENEFDKFTSQASLMGLGAPMYSTTPTPRFTEVGTDFSTPYSMRNTSYGHALPALHWSQWGGPFAGLQSTFGASPGQQKDKFSGAPTE